MDRSGSFGMVALVNRYQSHFPTVGRIAPRRWAELKRGRVAGWGATERSCVLSALERAEFAIKNLDQATNITK